ncbi:MAG: glutamate-5-semialdehyde dehydrogenase [Chthoniobacterales bacterium]|nr:glutamate-5-semialdehyde dehydrogenase [Chthoniobacterales bacterium]
MTPTGENAALDLKQQVRDFGRRARQASRQLSQLSAEQKNKGLLAMADEIVARTATILAANEKDLVHAREYQLAAAMIDRLTLTAARIEAMAQGIRQVAALPDPVGEILRDWTPPDGIRISKVRVPIGVIGIIYESRPNVTSDAAVLCTKTGNATILRGGSESIHSNLAIAAALQAGGAQAGLPNDSILLIPSTDRAAVRHMAEMDEFIDLIVPRGGKALIEAVVSAARMPVIQHSDGICIAYVDREADLEMALEIIFNGKTQRPGVCNALETVLVHREVAPDFLRKLAPRFAQKKVELRADEDSFAELSALEYQPLRRATEEDWKTEFLDYILALRVVDSPNDAIAHVGRFGSHHSDCIVTRNAATAEQFLREVDSATVYWNASTRFTDGGAFGFGAEIGISTDKLHARDPMGLEELTTYKYLIRGTGQVRS